MPTLTRINPMSTGQITLPVVDDQDAPVTDAAVVGDVYAPNGARIARDVAFEHVSGDIYTMEVDPAWSTDADGFAVQGRFRVIATITTDDLQYTERVSYLCAFPPD
jgi:hypothetical protein